jgi:predicted DCC family thiol-disulfide oxidoreductase YuxK
MAKVTVWYDGACPLCLREIAAMRRLDKMRAIEFIDVMDPEAECPIDRSELLKRFHARENGVLVSGAAAFAAMWRAIPLLRPLGLMAQSKLGLSVLEWLYIGFLRARPRIQRALRSVER